MERKVVLRRAVAQDIETILDLQRQAPEAAAWSKADYAELFPTDRTLCFLAEEEAGEAVGFLLARQMAEEMEILNLAVAPGWRRQGIGRRLVGEVMTRGQAQGVREWWLEVRASNENALAFYTALGFVEA
ncbi:MAG: GNAT family N-acetyltransferase, partial [Candidatus Acidiferrales bacterium]